MIDPGAAWVADLLNWYDQHAATLPWRGVGDPYRIWLSEIMLQQTQIGTVMPYYARFTARFPTVVELAAAPLDAVLKAWEGLGYYSRARNLHRAAQIIADQYGGQFPQTAAELLMLPGIGRYTAGAIASIAYGEQAAALDGNAIRVLTRLYDIMADVTRPATVRDLWTLADSLVPADRPGAYNQAIMDLGRTVCTTRHPRCGDCPIATHCHAREAGTQAERPVKASRLPTPHVDVAAGLIRRADGSLLIGQRHPDGLLGGLWGLPGGRITAGESIPVALLRLLNTADDCLTISGSIGTVSHAFTHFKMTLHIVGGFWTAVDLPLPDPPPDYAILRWVAIAELDIFAFARADRRAIDLAYKTGWLTVDPGLPGAAQTELWR